LKKLAAAAALAALSSPAFADSHMMTDNAPSTACSGYAEGYYGGFQIDSSGTDTSGQTFGGAVRANCNFNQRWNGQGDFFVDSLRATSGGNSTISNFGAAGHIYWRNPSSHALGGFGAIEGYDNASSFDGTKRYHLGVEGQVYLDRVTLYGQAYTGRHTINSSTAAIRGVRGMARYFATDNLRFEGEIGYRELATSSGSADTVVLGAEATYRFDDSPVSVFGRYQYDHITSSDTGRADIHKYVAGVKLSLGSKTLFEEDRHGATMDTARPNYFIY
jgi:hypothetical protein